MPLFKLKQRQRPAALLDHNYCRPEQERSFCQGRDTFKVVHVAIQDAFEDAMDQDEGNLEHHVNYPDLLGEDIQYFMSEQVDEDLQHAPKAATGHVHNNLEHLEGAEDNAEEVLEHKTKHKSGNEQISMEQMDSNDTEKVSDGTVEASNDTEEAFNATEEASEKLPGIIPRSEYIAKGCLGGFNQRCGSCHVAFRARSEYAKHSCSDYDLMTDFRQTVTECNEEKCESCGRAFSTKAGLARHKRSCLKKSQRQKCEFCDKEFQMACHLATHRKHSHRGQKMQQVRLRNEAQCTACEATFRHGWVLQRHEMVHRLSGVYRCSVCPRSFPFRSILRMHENKAGHKRKQRI